MRKAGVWWISMPFGDRIKYQAFFDNKEYIESKWDEQWGDRMNELVFIGQNMDKEKMIADLEKCLLQDSDKAQYESNEGLNDPFSNSI